MLKNSVTLTLVAALGACAPLPRFQSEPPGAPAADVAVRFQISSARSVVFVGVFRDGKQCGDLQITGVDGRATPSYVMRVKPETLTMVFGSGGEFNGYSGKVCRGTYSFDPRAGAKYEFRFFDEPLRCGASLAEIVDGRTVDISDKLTKRVDEGGKVGPQRCADKYVAR